MQGEFEKNIKNQLSNFNLEPSPQVWQEVRDALHLRKKRRVIAWWWLALPVTLFLTAGSIWWINNNEKVSSVNRVVLHSQKNIDSPITAPIKQENKANTTDFTKPINQQNIHFNQRTTNIINVVHKTTGTPGNLIDTGSLNHPFYAAETNTNTIASFDKDSKTTDKLTEPVSGVSNNSTNISTTPKSTIPAKDKTQDSGNKQKDSLLSLQPAITEKVHEKKNKHQWLVTAGGGFTKISERTGLFGLDPQNNLSYSSPTSGGSSGNNSAASNIVIPSPNNGFTFNAGIAYNKNVHRRWEFNIGLLYHYIQNKQYIGLDSVVTNTYLTYYSGVQTKNSKINYSHWLQLPVSFNYIFNPSSHYQLQLIGGGSLAWAFAEHWLITDKTNTLYPYHYNSSWNNHFITNLHLGVQLNCNDKFRITLLDEQSLTPIYKNTALKLYWQQFSLQLSKPFNLSKHPYKPPKK